MLDIHACDDGRGGSDDPIDEGDGITRGEVAEPVVVDNFQNAIVVHALDRLAEFIVIHHDDIQIRLVDELALTEDAHDDVVFIDDGKAM